MIHSTRHKSHLDQRPMWNSYFKIYFRLQLRLYCDQLFQVVLIFPATCPGSGVGSVPQRPHVLGRLSVFKSLCSTTPLTRINPLTPNDPYSSRTAPLTSKRCILYIYSTNTGTEYFKHGIYSLFFFSWKCSLFHNSNIFGSHIIHI